MVLRYVAGNTLSKALKVSKTIIDMGKIPVINYAVEHTNNNMTIYNEYKKLSTTIDNRYRVAIKLSSFNYDKYLVNDIIGLFADKQINVIVDAEKEEYNMQYHKVINDLIKTYNTNNSIIIKTYQMYRKDSLNTLINDISEFENLGTKIVRGAYWNREFEKGHLFTNKYDTDYNYNKCIMTLFENNRNNINILATHNTTSISIGNILNTQKNVFEFAHLLGMKESKYKQLLDKGETINVYLPYGPYSKMYPYLFRRLYENIDSIKYM